MTIRLYNTLGREIQEFKPLETGKVSMYHCGPTVYNYAHIGNLRAYILADLLRRLFEYEKYKITQVINITDFGHLVADSEDGDDKMTLALKRENKPMTLEAMRELGEFYTKAYIEDLEKLNVKLPHHLPKASDHIKEDIEMIQTLLQMEAVYQISDGLYFDTSRAEGYGKLAQLDLEKLKEGARVEINKEKRNPIDFAVWKLNPDFGWEAPWGKGFPGWHIECSAMAKKYLGESFDIHTGGIDHIPVHHTNEIAQSETASGKPLATYWLHTNFITIDNEKISKSLQNDIYLKDLEEKGINPLAYRYWLLTSHYQSMANFTWEALEGATKAYDKLVTYISEHLSTPHDDISEEVGTNILAHSIIEPLYDNLQTPLTIAEIWNLVKNPSYTPKEKVTALLEADRILGLDLQNQATLARVTLDIPEHIQSLFAEYKKAHEAKNYPVSDKIRDQIMAGGYRIDKETLRKS